MGFLRKLFGTEPLNLAGKMFASKEHMIEVYYRFLEDGVFEVTTSVDISMGHPWDRGTYKLSGHEITFNKAGQVFVGRMLDARRIKCRDLTLVLE